MDSHLKNHITGINEWLLFWVTRSFGSWRPSKILSWNRSIFFNRFFINSFPIRTKADAPEEFILRMPNKAQEDAVINLQSVQELGKQLGFEWPMVARELGFHRTEISQFHTATPEKTAQAQRMLECWYERSWNKLNKTKLLQDALERSGRKDLADKLRCLHWGHQKLSNRVELPSAFPFLITVYKTINNKEGLKKINQLGQKYT